MGRESHLFFANCRVLSPDFISTLFRNISSGLGILFSGKALA
jgi:hypothetical protein